MGPPRCRGPGRGSAGRCRASACRRAACTGPVARRRGRSSTVTRRGRPSGPIVPRTARRDESRKERWLASRTGWLGIAAYDAPMSLAARPRSVAALIVVGRGRPRRSWSLGFVLGGPGATASAPSRVRAAIPATPTAVRPRPGRSAPTPTRDPRPTPPPLRPHRQPRDRRPAPVYAAFLDRVQSDRSKVETLQRALLTDDHDQPAIRDARSRSAHSSTRSRRGSTAIRRPPASPKPTPRAGDAHVLRDRRRPLRRVDLGWWRARWRGRVRDRPGRGSRATDALDAFVASSGRRRARPEQDGASHPPTGT